MNQFCTRFFYSFTFSFPPLFNFSYLHTYRFHSPVYQAPCRAVWVCPDWTTSSHCDDVTDRGGNWYKGRNSSRERVDRISLFQTAMTRQIVQILTSFWTSTTSDNKLVVVSKNVEFGIQIGSDWPQMRQIWDFLRSVSVFRSVSDLSHWAKMYWHWS